MRQPFGLITRSRTVSRFLSAFLILGLVLPNVGPIHNPWLETREAALSQVPNYIFPNEVPAHGELGGGTANVVADSSGVRGDLIVRNHTDVWLTLSATASQGATISSDDLFVGFGVLPPGGSVIYQGDYTQADQTVSISAQYDYGAWLWNTADTILGLVPGGSTLNPSALGDTLVAIKGLNSIQKAANELKAIRADGWLSVPGHVLAAANELRKLATDDQQAALLQAILAQVGINVAQDVLKDSLIILSIFDELKHIAHTLVFFIVAPDGASVLFEAKCYGTPPPPVPPPAPPTPTPTPTTDNATFISDITLPDGTIVSPGQTLVKTWRVRNSGTSAWDGYKLAFASGDQMNATSPASIPYTSPGQEVDISITIQVPGSSRRGDWQIVNRGGTWVPGGAMWVKLTVPDGPPPSGDEIELTCLDCPSVLTPGQPYRPTVRAKIISGHV